MATTLVAFVAARLAFVHLVRPHLLAARHVELPLDPRSTGFGSVDGGPTTLMPSPPRLPNAWVRSVDAVDRAGHALGSGRLAALCPDLRTIGPPRGTKGAGPAPEDVKHALDACIAKVAQTYHTAVTYQPARQYWPFQWLEVAIYLGAALALAGLCVWWVRRRLT
jgi:hypothetical protein